MKKTLGLLAGLVLLLLAGICIFFAFKAQPPFWRLHNKIISLIIENTQAGRELGLGGRTGLSENSAMLFVFDKPDTYPFWMKDMKFPIDILWLDESYRIVHIESDLSPDTYPQTFAPSEKSHFVLETAAHFAEKNNLKIGEVLMISLPK